MIIKVDEYTEREERDELEKNGLHSVEINFGHIYIPKYADAGEGVEGSMEKRKLSGKTNAYSAPEVGKKDQMQYKADIFSLGKVLVELELASEFNVSLTRLEKIINESAKRGEDKVNTPEIILLEETRLFSRMKEILSENQKYKKNVMEEMLKANPELKEIVDKFEPVCEFLERDPLQIMYKKHLVLKEMIYAFLKVYYNKYIEEVETPYKVAQVDSVLDKNLRSNYKTHYQKLKETIPFYQKLKKDLFNIYMGMMNPNVNDRLRISEVHKIVVSLIKTYKKDQESLVNDLITFLKEYDHDNYSKDYYQDLTWLKENVIYSQCRRRILI
jgi:serine/threonine protein kinase